MIGKINSAKPIFIIGTGRSGSTLFYRIFSYHPQVAYISGIHNRFPHHPGFNFFNPLSRKLGKGLPSEAYNVFDRIMPGFSRAQRSLRETDVRKSVKSDLRELVEEVVKYQFGDRFLYKYTGWPRIGFFNSIFPDAKFIHLVRDGRAVAHSLLNVDWWRGWEGPQNWRWGELPEQYRQEWEDLDYSFAILAGIEWKIILDQVRKNKHKIEGRFFEAKYEKLIKEPTEVFEEIINFCELDKSHRFERKIKKFNLKNANYKWKEQFSTKEKRYLNESLKKYLRSYDYV